MDYLDMMRDMADADEPVDESEAQAIINGARDRLDELEAQARERHGLSGESGGDTPGPPGIPGDLRKPKSEHDRSSRADFYEAAREAGLDPNEEWEDLPE